MFTDLEVEDVHFIKVKVEIKEIFNPSRTEHSRASLSYVGFHCPVSTVINKRVQAA